jgi:Na+/melibiose symporter-like transporter
MWQQYRKTFTGMQVVITLVTLAVYFGMGRLPALAGLFFLTMQAGAVIGAAWAARLKRRLSPTSLLLTGKL